MEYRRSDCHIGAIINNWIITSEIYHRDKIGNNGRVNRTYFVKAICPSCKQEREVRLYDMLRSKSTKCNEYGSVRRYTNKYQTFGKYTILVIENIKNKEIYKFLFDTKFKEEISNHYWGVTVDSDVIYARGSDYTSSKNNNITRLHKFIYYLEYGDFDDKMVIDHKDRNTFNNTINNLNLVTPLENAQNASIRKDNTSGCKGVHQNKRNGKWVARIQYKGERIALGVFNTFEEAKRARLEAKKKYHKYNESIKKGDNNEL